MNLINLLKLFLMALLVANSAKSEDLKISRVSPLGTEIQNSKQITITFDRDMVALGTEADANLGIAISPHIDCPWRWLNLRTLSCELPLGAKLKRATTYQIKIPAEISALHGAKLPTEKTFEFTTTLPRVSYVDFQNWLSPGIPQMLVWFDQPICKASAQKFFKLRGTTNEQTYPIEVFRNPRSRRNARYIFNQKSMSFTDLGPQPYLRPDEKPKTYQKDTARRMWSVRPKQELPLGQSFKLLANPGIRSALGPEPTQKRMVMVSFSTFGSFSYKGAQCFDISGKTLFIHPEKTKVKSLCHPLEAVHLIFSAPVLQKDLAQSLHINGSRLSQDNLQHMNSYSRLGEPRHSNKTYSVMLPRVFSANSSYKITAKIRDEFNRPLPQSLSLTINFDHRPPDLRVVNEFSVLEKDQPSHLPLVITNLRSLEANYQWQTTQQFGQQTTSFNLPKVEDIAYYHPFKIRDLLQGRSGTVLGYLSSAPPAFNHQKNKVFFMSQVTPFHILVKFGHYNSQVWVTDMATGKPIKGAEVRLIKTPLAELLRPNPPILEQSVTDDDGISYLKGTRDHDPQLTRLSAWRREKPRLAIYVQKGDDMALLPLDNHFSLSTWQLSEDDIYTYNKPEHHHIKAWGTTPQGVYRTSDTIAYKIYLRGQDLKDLTPAPKGVYKLEVKDPKSKVVHQREDIQLNEFSTFSGSFKLSKHAAVGWYEFSLSSNFTKKRWQPMRVLVTDFKPSPFKVSGFIQKPKYTRKDIMNLETKANLHSGGPFTGAKTRVSARFQGMPFQTQSASLKGFTFQTISDSRQFYQKEGQLNEQGIEPTKIPLEKVSINYGKILVEHAVRDDRGKYLTSKSRATFRGLDRYVGIKNTAWTYRTGHKADILYAVADDHGLIQSGTRVHLRVEHLETKLSKVKGPGNAFLNKYTSVWTKIHECVGLSQETLSRCTFIPQQAGSLRFVAQIQDSSGRSHQTTIHGWAVGKGHVVWEEGPSNALTLLRDHQPIKTGDKARILVKNPYPGATALITVERYGILDSWKTVLQGSTPIIEIPIKESYLPGVYISVTAFSHRADDQKGFAKLDLGKPTFKMGYLKIPIQDKAKQLELNIQTDHKTYKPRGQVKATVEIPSAISSQGKMEAAIIVLDEAVFDLIQGGLSNYDPYRAFYQLNDLDVKNFSTLMKLIGRQKFDKKGANPGGGGTAAQAQARDLFKYVAYWNPELMLEEGKGSFQFELPDNLTSWRILAIVTDKRDRMGLGFAKFTVNQPTEIQGLLPNQVLVGDEFQAGFSILNRTQKPQTIRLAITATDAIGHTTKTDKTIELPPFKREKLFLPIKAQAPGALHFSATAKTSESEDHLKTSLKVMKKRSIKTAATFGSSTNPTERIPLNFPKDLHPDRGGLEVTLSPSLLNQLDGLFRYVKDYPYSCWEQKLTKALMASFYLSFKERLDGQLIWPKAEAFIQTTLKQAKEFQAPSGGMTFFIPKDDHINPYLSSFTYMGFAWLKEAGYSVDPTLLTSLEQYLFKSLRKNDHPDFNSKRTAATLRALTLSALGQADKIEPEDVIRYESHVDSMSLFGKAHYLIAALRSKRNETQATKTVKKILGHSIQTASGIQFNESLSLGFQRLLSTPMRANCMILSALLKSSHLSGTQDVVEPLARSIQSARKASHFSNTQENLFCLKALLDYSKQFEKTAPNMNLTVQLDEHLMGQAKLESLKDQAATLRKAMTKELAGTSPELKISKEGPGRYYHTTRMRYAPKSPFKKPHNAGFFIKRETSKKVNGRWQRLQPDAPINRGDIIRRDLYIEIPSARHFVVVDDPIPGGLEAINSQLATASQEGEAQSLKDLDPNSTYFKYDHWQSFGGYRTGFYHKELRFETARFFADYLRPGRYHLSYTAQAIATGTFSALPSNIEEMYQPEVYGKGVSSKLTIKE